MNYLDTLNKEQLEAVKQIEGPVLIMAGAGSGKTKALTCRIAYMLEQGIQPQEILAITFTNKAAGEMRERVRNLVGPMAEHIWMYTFHSFGARFLRREIDNYAPYTKKFTIYDSDDTKQLIKNILKELNLDDKQYQPQTIQTYISNAKNALEGPEQFRERMAGNFFNERVSHIYDLYDAYMKKNNALDFDDLLFVTAKLLGREEIRKRWQDRFHYILIDEYQDTNHAQYLMAKYIAGKAENICAVGDADQSIYSWRGADLRNIMDFRKDYKNAKIIKLEQNYRSTQTILNAANAVIKNNLDRPSKRLWTENNTGIHLQQYDAANEHEEADFVVTAIKKEHEENHIPYGQMAILYRMNAQSRVLEEGMVKRGIGYTMAGGTRFYDRAEIRDILAYLKVIENVKDDISLMRIINVPKRGIGLTTVQKLNDFAKSQGMSLFEAVMSSENVGLSKATVLKLQKFSALLFDLMNASMEIDVFSLIEKILKDTNYVNILRESKDPLAQNREENLGELLNVAKDFQNEMPEGKLPEFLEKVALVNDVDMLEEESDRVTMMTIHSAKGLEFPVVFLVGMDEGIFPGVRSLMDETLLEEERRLCYVAITRAGTKLYISTAGMRTMYGQIKPYAHSRFLKEIPEDLIDKLKVNTEEVSERSTRRQYAKQHSKWGISQATKKPMFTVSKKARYDWKVGDKVRHTLWGTAKVVEVSGKDKGMMLKLLLPGDKIRQVMVAYAPIEKEE